MAPHSFRGLSIVLLALACTAPWCRADADGDWEARREQERKNYNTMIAGMPLLNEQSIGRLFQLRLEGKSLVLRTPKPSTPSDAYMRVKLADSPMAGLIRIQGGAKPSQPPAVPTALQFNLTDYSKPRMIATISINTQLAYFSISKSTQSPGGYRNVTLMQQGNPASEEGGVVQLTVNEAERERASPLNLDLQCPDFFSLARSYPQECDQYLRPMLRELGQESVFTPDPFIAWQVFADQWKPDPQVRREVSDLLPGLDADDFRQRARTSAELEKLGREGAAVLIHLDRGKLTPEQNARVDRALGPYAQLPVRQVERLRTNLPFLLDCLYSDDVTLRRVALDRVKQIVGPTVRFDIDAEPASREAAIAVLRKTLLPPGK